MDYKNGMGMIKRAALFIARKKSKSLILLTILIVLMTLLLAGISIRSAAEATAASLRQTLGGYFKIQTNWESRAPDFVTDSLVEDVMQDEKIKAYNKMSILYLMAEKLTPIPGRFTAENNTKAQLLRVLSNTDSSLHEYFYTRTFTLISGRHVAPGDVGKVLVSSALAGTNCLQLGDTITLALPDESIAADSPAFKNRYDVEIVGIYAVRIPQTTDERTAECDIPDNFLFIDENTVKQMDLDISGKPREVYPNGAAFFLHDPQDLDAAVEQAAIDGEAFVITVNSKAYDDSAAPLSKLVGYANTLVAVILVIGILLLSLIMTMWMRDRLHEIGILLSIGIKKISLWGQHIVEALMIMLISLAIAWPIAGVTADKLGNYLLNSVPIEEQAENDRMSAYNLGPVVVSEIGRRETLEVHADSTELITVICCSVLMILLSVSVSSIVIFKMRPKEILSSTE